MQEETARKAGKQPLIDRLKPLEEEQKAIRRAAEQLSVPPGHAEANKLRQQIGERAVQAADAIQKQDSPQAQAKMEETKNLLHRLSDVLPNLEQRRQQARREVERLRRQQEEIVRQSEQIKKDDPSAAQRQAEAARRQAETAEALSKMDTPNQEGRRERATEALNRALADLLDGRRDDVPASQQEAKRQLDRLAQRLRGEKPADEQRPRVGRETTRTGSEGRTRRGRRPRQRRSKSRSYNASNNNWPSKRATSPLRKRRSENRKRPRRHGMRRRPRRGNPGRRKHGNAWRKPLVNSRIWPDSWPAKRATRPKRSGWLSVRLRRPRKPSVRPASRPRPKPSAASRKSRGKRGRSRRRGSAARKTPRHGGVEAREETPAKEQAQARRQAADALRDLADRLAGRNDPAAKANEIARQQRDLAARRRTRQADKASAEEAKKAAARQAELKRQLERLDSKAAAQAANEAAEKMGQAAAALEQAKSPGEAKDALAHAADAAEKAAEQLGKAHAANKPADSPTRTVSASQPLRRRNRGRRKWRRGSGNWNRRLEKPPMLTAVRAAKKPCGKPCKTSPNSRAS